jgi:hypothetical protein
MWHLKSRLELDREPDRDWAKPGLPARNVTEPSLTRWVTELSSSRLISDPIHNRKFLYHVGVEMTVWVGSVMV